MAIRKGFASIKRDAQEINQPPTAHSRENLRTLNACYAKAIARLYDLKRFTNKVFLASWRKVITLKPQPQSKSLSI